jgi:hypothetical protein
MAAIFNWCEDNGALASGHGTVRSGYGADTHYPNDVNWKNVDDCTANSGTLFTAAPITAGNNSFTKYQYGKFTGSFTNISSGLWSANTTGALASGLTLKGTVTSTYVTPATTINAALTTDFTPSVVIGAGLAVLFSATDPSDGAPTSTLAVAGYTQYLATQLQTSGGAAAGNTSSCTTSLQYNEN